MVMSILIYLAQLAVSLVLWIAIPVIITLFIGFILRRLDIKWIKEGKDNQAEAIARAEHDIFYTLWARNPCWEENNCSPEDRVNCKAYQQSEKPCWEVYRKNGTFSKDCADCSYREKILVTMDTESIGEFNAN